MNLFNLVSIQAAVLIALSSCERVDSHKSSSQAADPASPPASTPAVIPEPPAPPVPDVTPDAAPVSEPVTEPTLAPAPELPAVTVAPTTNPAALPEMETIMPKWPKEQIVGTPVPTDLPNLEDPSSNPPQIQFQVPKGSTNLAAGKPSTSSTEVFILGDIAMVTDGDREGSDGSVVELDPGVQWVQIDLGIQATISKVLVWHRHSKSSAYKAVAVQISDDPKFENGVTTVWNSDITNTLGFGEGKDPTYLESKFGRIMNANNTVGRYVRLWSNGNTGDDLNHYTEVEVWGLSAAP